MSENCTHDCSSCSADCSSRDMRVPANAMSSIKRVIAVGICRSGRGKYHSGVGAELFYPLRAAFKHIKAYEISSARIGPFRYSGI